MSLWLFLESMAPSVWINLHDRTDSLRCWIPSFWFSIRCARETCFSTRLLLFQFGAVGVE